MAIKSGSGLLEWIAVAAKMNQVRTSAGEIVGNGTSSSSYGVEWMSLIHELFNASNAKNERARQVRPFEERVGEVVFRVLEDFVGVDMKRSNPITKNLPMVASPVPVLACVALYLLVVWLWSSHIKSTGQKPRKEDPRALRYLVIFHNLFLCVLSFFMGVGLIAAARHYGYNKVWGNLYVEREPAMNLLVYVFYISKLYEFMDTAIMLFRRNLRQVTFLHIYHHASITLIWWIICYRTPGADAYFSAAFNSCIHVVMYLYYLLAATVARDEKRRRKYLFWGKYLTVMQMVQFLSFIGQAIYAMWQSEFYPKGFGRMLFFYSCSLLAFFGNFFVKKYSRPKEEKIVKVE